MIKTRRTRLDDDWQVRYVVAGTRGAVEYHAIRSGTGHGMVLGIKYHSPRPRYGGDEPSRCYILEGPCYVDGTSLGGVELRRRWEQAGRDDEVIWQELERRYAAWVAEDGAA